MSLVMLLAWDAAVGTCHLLLEDEHQVSFDNGEINGEINFW